MECPSCHKVIRSDSTSCPHCQVETTPQYAAPTNLPARGQYTEANKWLGVGGGGLMAIGVFGPMVTTPFGEITAIRGGQGDGIFILVLGLAALASALVLQMRLVGIGGLLAGAWCAYQLFTISNRLAGIQGSDNPFSQTISSAIGFGWGLGAIALGAALSIAAYFYRQP